jgi:hypothetical protein
VAEALHALATYPWQDADYQFVMRCWTLAELQSGLASGGFRKVAYFSAYDDAVEAGRTARLVAVAQR